MKRILIFIVFIFSFVGFSQTGKLIYGKVLVGESALSSVDIVNVNSKKITKTDRKGNFNILAKVNDELLIITKEHIDQTIVLTQKEFDKNNLIIRLVKKPIELNEVEVTKVPSAKFKVSQAELDQTKLAKQASTPKVVGVYDGTIENGIDFVRLGKEVVNLSKNKDNTETTLPPMGFKEYMAANFTNDFYIQKLKLNPDEISLFLSYCDADPKSKIISAHQDGLETTDFLISKNEEFKKLKR